MKLLMDGVWNITKDHRNVLEAAESFLKTHHYVQEQMIKNKSRIKSNFSVILRDLVKLRFIQCFGPTFKLSLSGFDCVAINKLRELGLNEMGSPIGIGKESDIYLGKFKKNDVAIKVHRLGRSSFTRIEERELNGEDNWFSANKESAYKEAQFLQLFSKLPVPTYYCYCKHMVVMELLDSYDTLYRVTVEEPEIVSNKMLLFLKEMWDMGYAHGDFNEFNVMVCGSDIKVIDFPQCVVSTDPKAIFYLKRDIECVHKYFWKKNRIVCDDSMFADIYKSTGIQMDVERNGYDLYMDKYETE